MIRGKLRLISSTIARQWRRHDTRVIDKHVQRSTTGKKLTREGIDGGRIEQVQSALFHAWNAAESLACFVRGTGGHDHCRTCFSKSTCRLQADARVSACDDGNFTPQVYAMERLPGRGCGSETGVDRCLFTGQLLSPHL